ncbi:MAG: response regulator [Desulfobacteraceae bacterium]|jgi:DNA-binding NtrC family response regulator|nr:response regulator [Desulfobacteraceae bacterium]
MQKKRVLVIDDERIVLDSITRILKEEDFEVDVTLSGRQGLQWAVAKDYDIVLTDLRMPDIGGMRVLRDIKRAKPAVPVVMITGFGSVKSAVQAMKLGAAEYLEKPFDPDALVKVVQKALHIAATTPPEEQRLIHKEEILKVLERAATDYMLVYNLLHYGAEALDDTNLTAAEKLAVLSGDIQWIEAHVGELNATQRKWLEGRLSAEIW